MITSITLDNFKCFQKETPFKLSRVNLLSGFNGAGKSSICQSILMIAQSIGNDGAIDKLCINGDFVSLGLASHIPNCNSGSDIFGISWTTDASSGCNIEWKFKAPAESTRRSAKIESLVKDGVDQFQEIKGLQSVMQGDGNAESFRHLMVDDWSFTSIFNRLHYIGADRLGPSLFEKRSDLKSRNPLGVAGEHKMEYLSSMSPEQRRKVEEIVSDIMGREIQIDVNDDGAASDVLSLWYIGKNGAKVSCVNTGFGFTYVLSLILCAVTCADSIIIIENPEAHLHPKAQSRLMIRLAALAIENNNQMIIESHSENVLNGLRLAVVKDETPLSREDISIHFFGINVDPMELTINKDAQISPWPKGFYDQEDDDLAEIMKAGIFKD